LLVTGLGTFFTHEPDPNWFNFVEGQGVQPSSVPSEGWAEWHGLFADAAFVLVLFGSAWFVYKVSFRLVRFSVLAFVLIVAGHISGSAIRYNVVKLQGRTLKEAGEGYTQLFAGELEFIVTARFQIGAIASQLWVIAHVATLPLAVAGALWSLRQIGRSDPFESVITPIDPPPS
jgi:hypothetical protein